MLTVDPDEMNLKPSLGLKAIPGLSRMMTSRFGSVAFTPFMIISVLAYCPDDPSSIPADYYKSILFSICTVRKDENK